MFAAQGLNGDSLHSDYPNDSILGESVDSDLYKYKMDPKNFLKNDISGVSEVGQLLGQGAFSQVFACTIPSLGGVVALKVSMSECAATAKEATLSLELQHPGLIKLLAVLHHSPLCLAYAMCAGGTLAAFFQAHPREAMPEWEQRLKPASEVNHALSYLHERHIIHRDVKPANIFLTELCHVDESGRVSLPAAVLGDMGMARSFEPDQHDMMSRCGSPDYVAPEVYAGTSVSYDSKVDVFSLTVLIYNLMMLTISGNMRDLTATSMNRMLKVMRGFRPSLDGLPGGQKQDALRATIQAGWAHDPKDRPTSQELACMIDVMVE
jgi:serine/threonine protein kinase